ncbi:MAG TPA: flavodoxin domain-containing protein [Spirochaetia bacterium]|nr:flavodoxin domain-containing protein [Spirochaetales bacterium]HRS65513.1 flavodoxin domain-containing protein [Spirochaetia bacterium]HOT58922.1 flavodoxin domain-containing protein [Spirochaetales bacterium]HPD80580.1 flavodoxin domain-containing protein [Spirochaetales bacterium]HQK35326.1 flavodoxin domain-containing protein [Spirochaetales bacterium]
MNKPLIVYTSRTGHARTLAEKLGKLLTAPVHEVIDRINRKGFFRFLFSGFQAVTKKATPIDEAMIDLSQHDSIIIVVPVWASNMVPPMRTWLQKHRSELANKPIAILATCKGSDSEPYIKTIQAEFPQVTYCKFCYESETDIEGLLKRFVAELQK